MANLRRYRVLLPSLLMVAGLAATAPPAAAASSPPGGFTAVTPARILDTRAALGAPAAKVGPGQTIELQVAGRGGVPATGAGAVSLNVAVTEPSAEGYLTAWPAGEARPVASTTNFAPGQTVSTAAVVKLGAGGRIAIFNASGTSHVIADVAGWHAADRHTGSPFTPQAPTRVFDSRQSQPLAPGGTVRVPVGPLGATAVALNVTATEPTAPTFLTVFPAGEALPLAANLNVVPGQTRGNFVAVKVGDGEVQIYNNQGTTHVVVDLLGYWSPTSQSRMEGLSPSRILDTRLGLGAPDAPLGPGQTATLALPGPSAVPIASAAGVVLNVTVTGPEAGGWLTVYPGSTERPFASNLNFAAGETVPNLVIVPLNWHGTVEIYNSGGPVEVIADVVGWLDAPWYDRDEVLGVSAFGSDVVVDPTSTYAYISNPGQNQVEVLRLADGTTFEAPILVGSQPMGLDLSPSGDVLYVANRGSAFVSVVDVAARTELRRFSIPADVHGGRPYSIAVLANGTALLTTTFSGSGYGGKLYLVDLATETFTLRTDFGFGGSTTERTTVRASGDRSSAMIAEYGGAVVRYDIVTDTFVKASESAGGTGVATNLDASVTLVSGLVFDRDLNLSGTVPGCANAGVAVTAAGTVGYGLFVAGNYPSYSVAVTVCDLVRFKATTIHTFPGVEAAGRMALSPDGRHLVGIIENGIVMVRP